MGVNVNAVAPGFVDTEMTQGLKAEQRQQIVRRSALRRLTEIDDVAGRGRVPAWLEIEKHHGHGTYGRRRQHGMTASLTKRPETAGGSAAKAWARALELTASIARHPDRLLPR
jgi:hypothetical protein